MSMLFGENKCMFKAACALAFLLVLILTACDATDVNSPTEIGGLACNDGMEVDGGYLEVINTDGDGYSYSYYKCENGKWISVDEAEAYSSEETKVFTKYLGVEGHIKRDLADFRKCNAKNEGLVDSTVEEYELYVDSITLTIDFYTCKNNEWVYDDEASCDVRFRYFKIGMSCDESYGVDGAYYEITRSCSSMPRYSKCENNKWSLLPKGDVPPDSAIVLNSSNKAFNHGEVWVYFKKCNAENEGLIDSAYQRTESRFGYPYKIYYRCEQGSWKEVDETAICDAAGVSPGDDCIIYDHCYKYLGDGVWDRVICLDNLLPQCDTAGVSVGAICTKDSCYCVDDKCLSRICDGLHTYLYMGMGVWKTLTVTDDYGNRRNYADSSLAQWTKECTAENEGETEKHVYGIAPDIIELYYKCVDGKWTDMSETDYYCPIEKPKIGDTCSANLGDSTRYYMYMNAKLRNYTYTDMWVIIDPVLGYCPKFYNDQMYALKDGKYYCCDAYFSTWTEVSLVPHQYTDPRKEGLTDEEYDVLDLPKEASVGDRISGLLEVCLHHREMPLGTPEERRCETYHYCISKNYYRYRENGTWTLETWDDIQDDPSFNAPDCTPETEGMEWSIPPISGEPGQILKRKKVTSWDSDSNLYYECDDETIGYIFNQSQKLSSGCIF